MLPCAICGLAFAFAYPCSKVHQDHCHECYTLSLAASYDGAAHPAPREVPVPWLSRRELAAVAAYQRRVLALVGPQDLARVLTEEGEA